MIKKKRSKFREVIDFLTPLYIFTGISLTLLSIYSIWAWNYYGYGVIPNGQTEEEYFNENYPPVE